MLLSLLQATFASKVEISSDGLSTQVTREIDGGLEVLHCALPAVITTDLRLNEPRYATLPNIMRAKSKPFKIESLKSLGLSEVIREISNRQKITEILEPPKRKGGITVSSVDELIEKLRNEAGVL